MPDPIPAEAVQAATRAVEEGRAEMHFSGGTERIEFTAEGFAAWYMQARAEIAEKVRTEERAAIIAGIRDYFAPVDDPLYEDVRILCGRIERGEYAPRQTGGIDHV